MHELAVGQVGHHCRFVPCTRPHHLPEWLAGTCANSGQRHWGKQQSKPVHDQSTASSVSHSSDWLKGYLITIKHLGHTLLALRVLNVPTQVMILLLLNLSISEFNVALLYWLQTHVHPKSDIETYLCRQTGSTDQLAWS